MIWEHLVVDLEVRNEAHTKKLNELGEQGWELVAMEAVTLPWVRFALKRPKPDEFMVGK